MGDRALIIFHSKDKTEYSPVTYLHWGGSSVGVHLEKLKELMKDRRDDVNYASARFVGICHSATPDSALSLGMWNLPDDFKDEPEYLKEYSHGDAGVLVVDADTFEARCYGGYGLGREGR